MQAALIAPSSKEKIFATKTPGRTSTSPIAENRSVSTSPVLHLQDAVARDHVHNRKHHYAKASQLAETMQNIFDGVAFSGQGREFGGQPGEQQNRESEQQPDYTAQNLIE